MGDDFEDFIKKQAAKDMADLKRKEQAKFDQLFQQHRGKSLTSVKPAVAQAFRGMSDAKVTEYAKAISEGTRIVLR